MKNKLSARSERYFKLSSAIAQIDNDGLYALFGDSEAEPGWGRNHVIEVAGTKVFAKRVPMTALEDIHALGMMKLAKSYVASIVKYRSIILLKHDFYVNMRNNQKKDDKFPHAKLRRLLKETGFVTG